MHASGSGSALEGPPEAPPWARHPSLLGVARWALGVAPHPGGARWALEEEQQPCRSAESKGKAEARAPHGHTWAPHGHRTGTTSRPVCVGLWPPCICIRFLGSGWKKQYTFWPAHALWQRSLLLRRSAAEGVTGELFPQLAANYRDWQRTHYSQKAGCIFQSCHADGQENSAGLDGCRPTVTAAQYGEASALAAIAAALHNSTEAAFFRAEAAKWQGVLQGRLWSEELGFFVTEAQPPPPNLHAELRRMGRLGRMREVQTYFGCLACDRRRACPPGQGWPEGKRVGVRELMGLTSPWYFSAVPRGSKRVAAYAEAFSQLDDPAGFGAKCGPRPTFTPHHTHTYAPAHPLTPPYINSSHRRTPPHAASHRPPPLSQVGASDHRAAQQRMLQLQQSRAVQLERRCVAIRDLQGRHRARQPTASLPRAGVCMHICMCICICIYPAHASVRCAHVHVHVHVHCSACCSACCSAHACVCALPLRSARRRVPPSSGYSSRTHAHTRARTRRDSRRRMSTRTCTQVHTRLPCLAPRYN